MTDDMIPRAEADVLVAVVIEAAAKVAFTGATSPAAATHRKAIANAIRALTPDDARAALEDMLAEAEKRGKKRGLLWAAEICDECYLAKRAANEIRAEAKE